MEGSRDRLLEALRFFFAALGSLALGSTLSAQAWVPPKGEGSFGLGYQNYYVRDHYFEHGTSDVPGRVRTNSFLLDVGYGLTDRLAFAAAIPYVYSRYDGKSPHQLPIDDGNYHGVFADYRVEFRYNTLRKSLYLTPFVAAVIPSHNYTYFAHSAASKDLHEYQLGFNVGRRLDPFIPDAVVHLRYGFTFAEKVLGVSHNRSNLILETGYFLTPSLTLKGIGLYTRTYGGVDFPPLGSQAFLDFRASPYWRHHDQLARNNDLSFGGGMSYAITGSMDVYGTYVTSVWGQNGHRIQPGIAVGANWGFSPAQLVRKLWPKGSRSAG